MNRLPRTLLLLAGCVTACALRAQTAAAPDPLPESSWTVTSAVTSQYPFRGTRVAGASFQPAVDFAYGPLAAGVWSSVGLEDQASGDADPELDFYATYTLPLGRSGAEIVPGIQLYTYPGAERNQGLYSATLEPSVAVNVVIAGIRFTPQCYYDLMLKGATFECAADVALPLTTLGTELRLSASLGTFRWNAVTADASPEEKNWGDYWTVAAAVPYQVTANSTIELALLYSEGRNNFYKQGTDPRVPNEDAVGRAAVTLSYSIAL